jgi:hypothetical protein
MNGCPVESSLAHVRRSKVRVVLGGHRTTVQQQRAVSVTAPCVLTLLLGGALVGDFTALRLSLSACFGAGASESSANSYRVPSLLSVTFCCPERGASTTNATTRTLIPAVGCMVALLTTPLSHATLTTRAKKYTRACGRRAPHRVVRRTTARRTPRRGV